MKEPIKPFNPKTWIPGNITVGGIPIEEWKIKHHNPYDNTK